MNTDRLPSPQPRPPHFGPTGLFAFWLQLGLLFGVSACQRSDDVPDNVLALVDKSLVHLAAAEAGLQEAGGDWKRLAEFSMHYRMVHSSEFSALRTEGEALTAKLSQEQRQRLAVIAQQRAAPTLAKIELAAQRFADPQRALQMVRPLVVAGTPQTGRKGPPQILPEVPPHPASLPPAGAGLPSPPTPIGTR